jgi:hypothetical protein
VCWAANPVFFVVNIRPLLLDPIDRNGSAGMFRTLAIVSALFTLPALWFPGEPEKRLTKTSAAPAKLGVDDWRVLIAMALFTFGSLAIWPFMERAAHAIGLSAVTYGRYQSIATIASMLSNLGLATVSVHVSGTLPLARAFLVCGLSCAALTTVTDAWAFALALLIFNASWFMCYPLLMGIGYSVDDSGRLAVLSSAVWLLMMSLGSLTTGFTAELLRGYRRRPDGSCRLRGSYRGDLAALSPTRCECVL